MASRRCYLAASASGGGSSGRPRRGGGLGRGSARRGLALSPPGQERVCCRPAACSPRAVRKRELSASMAPPLKGNLRRPAACPSGGVRKRPSSVSFASSQLRTGRRRVTSSPVSFETSADLPSSSSPAMQRTEVLPNDRLAFDVDSTPTQDQYRWFHHRRQWKIWEAARKSVSIPLCDLKSLGRYRRDRKAASSLYKELMYRSGITGFH